MDTCDRCEEPCDELVSVEAAAQTYDSPAEYEGWCLRCCEQVADARDRDDNDEYDRRVDDALCGLRPWRQAQGVIPLQAAFVGRRDPTRWGRLVSHQGGFRYSERWSGNGQPQRKRRRPGWMRGERKAQALARLRRREARWEGVAG